MSIPFSNNKYFNKLINFEYYQPVIVIQMYIKKKKK